MGGRADEEPPPTREQAAAYVADLTGTLARYARGHGLDHLSYLLEIASLEAKHAAGQWTDTDPSVS